MGRLSCQVQCSILLLSILNNYVWNVQTCSFFKKKTHVGHGHTLYNSHTIEHHFIQVVTNFQSPFFLILFTLWKWLLVVYMYIMGVACDYIQCTPSWQLVTFPSTWMVMFSPIWIKSQVSSKSCYISLWFNHVLFSYTFHTKICPPSVT